MLSAASTLSSTTRMRRPSVGSFCAVAAGLPGAPSCATSLMHGSTMLNFAPFPGPSLVTSTRPWCSSTSRWTTVSPTPRPPRLRSSERSPCEKSSNTLGSSSRSMPMPLSRTSSRTSPSAACALRTMLPPSGVYLAELFSRLAITCASRAKSPTIHTGEAGRSSSSLWPRASISGRAVSTACEITFSSSRVSLRMVILPCVMRDTSSSSSTSCAMCVTWRSTTSRAQTRRGSEGAMRRRSSTALRIGASGLRSSCESIARNSSLRRLASRSFSSASRVLAISCFRLQYRRAFSSAIPARPASSASIAWSAGP